MWTRHAVGAGASGAGVRVYVCACTYAPVCGRVNLTQANLDAATMALPPLHQGQGCQGCQGCRLGGQQGEVRGYVILFKNIITRDAHAAMACADDGFRPSPWSFCPQTVCDTCTFAHQALAAGARVRVSICTAMLGVHGHETNARRFRLQGHVNQWHAAGFSSTPSAGIAFYFFPASTNKK